MESHFIQLLQKGLNFIIFYFQRTISSDAQRCISYSIINYIRSRTGNFLEFLILLIFLPKVSNTLSNSLLLHLKFHNPVYRYKNRAKLQELIRSCFSVPLFFPTTWTQQTEINRSTKFRGNAERGTQRIRFTAAADRIAILSCALILRKEEYCQFFPVSSPGDAHSRTFHTEDTPSSFPRTSKLTSWGHVFPEKSPRLVNMCGLTFPSARGRDDFTQTWTCV